MKKLDFIERKRPSDRLEVNGIVDGIFPRAFNPARSSDRKHHLNSWYRSMLQFWTSWQHKRRFEAERERLNWQEAYNVLADLGTSREALGKPASAPEGHRPFETAPTATVVSFPSPRRPVPAYGRMPLAGRSRADRQTR